MVVGRTNKEKQDVWMQISSPGDIAVNAAELRRIKINVNLCHPLDIGHPLAVGYWEIFWRRVNS